MGQVPNHYAIIGDGRVASHMTHYMTLLGLPYSQWSRRENTESELPDVLAQATHVLVLLSDAVIVDWVHSHHAKNPEAIWIHCSGVVSSPQAYFAHPLFSFSRELYTLDRYEVIPFFISTKAPAWQCLLPGFPNPHHTIAEKDRELYHAYCVLSNNVTVCAWQHVLTQMKNRLGIEPCLLQPYLRTTFEQLTREWGTALTGPMVRGDWATCQKDLNALEEDSFQPVLKSLMKAAMSEEEWDEYHQVKS